MFSSGWTLDDVLDLSWDQLQVVGRCMAEYRAFQLNILLEIASGALGGKHKPSRRGRKPIKKPDAAQQFAAAGFDLS